MGYKRVQTIQLYSYTFQELADLLELRIHSLGRCVCTCMCVHVCACMCVHTCVYICTCVCVCVCDDWKKCSVSQLGVGYKTGIQLAKFHQALRLICTPCHGCITHNKKLFLLEMIIKMYVHLVNIGNGKGKTSKW